MEQGNFSSNNAGYFSDTQHNQQIQNANPQRMNIPQMHEIRSSSSSLGTSGLGIAYGTNQPPPYQTVRQPSLPGMTSTFSQRLQSSFSDNMSAQHSYQNAQNPYNQSYNVAVPVSSVLGNTQNIYTGSPGNVNYEQVGAVRNLSPVTAMPRKSLVGMMSPIRSQIPHLNMPPPSSVVSVSGRIPGPQSPLLISAAQSPQRRPQVLTGHPQSLPHVHPPQSPVYQHQQLMYAYSPQSAQASQYSPQSSPVATSPRYMAPAQHSQLSPLVQSPGHLHSPQAMHMSGIQVSRTPYIAARQLSMNLSPTKAHIDASGSQHWQQARMAQASPQKMWETPADSSLVPSLPVLSSDTLDLLSTLTVSTVTSPVLSSTVHSMTEARVQKSPLLQKHLLMPAPSIRPQVPKSIPNEEFVRATAPTTETGSESTVEMQSFATPPSRSNLKHSVRPTSTQSSKKDINLENIVLSTCTVTTLYSSSIVTSVVNSENNDKLYKREIDKTVKVSVATEPMQVSMTDANIGIRLSVTHAAAETTSQSTGPTADSVVSNTVESMDTEGIYSNDRLPPDIIEKRAKLCEIQRAKLKEKLELYKECLTELFFLQNGGNCMDFIQFKKRPSSKLLEYLDKKMPDGRPIKQKQTFIRRVSRESVVSNSDPKSPASDTSNSSSKKDSLDDRKRIELRRLSHENTEHILQPKVIQQTIIETGLLRTRSRSHDEIPPVTTMAISQSNVLPKTIMSPQLQVNLPSVQMPKGQLSPLRSKRLSRQNVPVSLDESIGSQEEILERAKQEAVIQRKVVELRKQGLWTQRRLPKVQEPPRNKTHWDYLLEEMRWLATDFAQERKWKRAAARKLVRTVNAYHKEQHDRVKRAEREEQNRLRRIASTMAREIRIFWGNIGKVVEYKQRSLLDEKRQKALDMHLSFIVDQTEKYSDWLSQGLNQTSVASSPTRSLNSSKPGSDDDFLPQGESSDDEETIAVAEQELEKSDNCEDEISLLQQESQLPFDELINSLPDEVIQNIGKPLNESETEKVEEAATESKEDVQSSGVNLEDNLRSDEENSESCDEEGTKPSPIALRRSARKRRVGSEASFSKDEPEPTKKQKLEQDANDDEFRAEQDSDEDDEATVEEEEKKVAVDHKKEIEDLQAESEMPIEELMKMYGDAFNQDPDQEEQVSEDDNEEQEDESAAKEDSQSEESDEEENEMEAEEEEVGMDYLLKADLTKDDNMPMIVPAESPKKEEAKPTSGESSPNKEITDVAAEAASLQPTGFTLATTQVVTPIPSLLKHTLREYQHIGLDWLVTMYDKRLNGILADEMGLGKTIQTIALLAHLACEKGVWGPHLIVVPTSVMLNWEMEFKKWCPGFKILTYYGSQKERKAKRTGWTKSNAFHVCITSYKLVLQDNVSFRRKKWKYLVLDEAQNIKNFKSQRWQTLLNFNSQRRLLLTGTPLQNNLMELWSLMHFLMPHVFQSHKEFKEWFSNPLTGMIEGVQEYNEKLVRRLHKVLRPFLLRRIKKDVEKQMPNKYEHVVRCHLSKRQRFLYEDFMSRASTKDTLDSGHFMSVINVLMQLRKVCNHPNLFESRPIVSPFSSDCIDFHVPSLVTKVFEKSPFESLNLQDYHLHLPSLTNISQYQAERIKQLRAPRKLIEELGGCVDTSEQDSSQAAKTQIVREQLGTLLKERERLRTRNAAILNLPQQPGLQPVITLPITSGTGTLQLTTSAGTTIFPSRVLTIPQSRAEDSAPSQSFTLQYQTPQGTRVTIPNRQIRQLPGGVVQIMTPATKASSVPSHAGQGITSVHNGTAEMRNSLVLMDVEDDKGGRREKLEFEEPTSYVERLRKVLVKEQKQKLSRMVNANEMHCRAIPEWLPQDTIDHLRNIYRRPSKKIDSGKVCLESDTMNDFLMTNSTVIKEMKPITDRFVFLIPKAEAPTVDFHVSHPSPSQYLKDTSRSTNLGVALKKEVAPLHFINQAMKIQFPEARLIQYDCGKLQVLDVLLRRFWREKHKCLIFTQMTKVLDVLEAFLSYHGYRYLRLDGSTRVEQRMLLMERFNNDPRIFCFILSTRSGGVGVNLTGADTVIFYDSDWNPTMDAQAQDRCHRIGQTRDVHIYRLISERTVEENILKKANQKRLLGDLAIEGGSFTTAFFKEQAIKDLFNEPSGLEDLASVASEQPKDEKPPQVLSRPITARQKAIAAAKELEAKGEGSVSKSSAKKDDASNWEDALQQTEDKEDVDAARQLREEQNADMEEFTENADGEEAIEGSRVQEEMKSLYEELTPIEKYALKYLEETTEEYNKEELELADEEVERSKQDWEITHLMALKEEEERRLEEEEDEIFYTRDDAENQIFIDDVTGETMSIWFPPTPPQDENDIYVDPISCLLYQPHTMSEEQLPQIQVRRERKRTKTESESPGGASHPKRKMSRSEFHAPRSLFDRPILKKRDIKHSKYRSLMKKVTLSTILAPPALASSVDKENVSAPTAVDPLTGTSTATVTTTTETATDTSFTKNPEWLVNEDWKLLQAIQQVLEMPLSLAVLMPAHTPNWDLVADIVNSVCSVYRSPKMCKQRFENVIGPREEDRSITDISLKKKSKGTKTPTKMKPSKTQKTTNQHSLDNNAQHTALYTNRFDVIMETSTKRSTPLKSSSSGQFQRNPKHTSILLENGISYDKPLPPIQAKLPTPIKTVKTNTITKNTVKYGNLVTIVATLRADRIAREKQAIEVAKQQQLVQTQTIQQHPTNISQLTAAQVAKPAGISTLSQLTAIPLSGSANNIIVNSSTLSALTKKMNQQSGGMVQFSGKTSKVTLSNTVLQQTLLRTVSGSDQSQTIQHQPQIQIQQQSQVGTMVTVSVLQRLSSTGTLTTAVSNNNTITLSTLRSPITVPTGALQQGSQQISKQVAKLQQQRIQQQQLQLQKQQKKPIKAQITPQKLQITPETMKRLRQCQQLEVAGKQRKTLTQQELEQLLKNPNIRRQIQKPQTAQVQIAPVHAQVQAQQVQEAAAQQAAQHIVTSKPLPITVPVSNLVSVTAVNLAGMNMSIPSTSIAASGQARTITGQQVPQIVPHRLFQRQLLKQRMAQPQPQTSQNRQGQVLASKVGVKQTVYAMVAAPPLSQTKRRVNVTASAAGALVGQQQSSTQQPVQLTVTKLLQSQAIPGQSTTQIKQSMAQQGTITQIQQPQMVTQQQVATATILPSSNVGQAQRLITTQRNVMSVQQLVSNQQMILTSAPSVSIANSQQFLQRQNPNVVASVSLAAGSALNSPSQQLQNLLMPQVMRAQSQANVTSQTMRPAIPQQLVLSQINPQQTLSISPQTAVMPQTNPAAPTTMTLAPSLVQLPVSVAGQQGQAMMVQTPMSVDGSTQSQQQTTTASVQYVTRTMPQQ